MQGLTGDNLSDAEKLEHLISNLHKLTICVQLPVDHGGCDINELRFTEHVGNKNAGFGMDGVTNDLTSEK